MLLFVIFGIIIIFLIYYFYNKNETFKNLNYTKYHSQYDTKINDIDSKINKKLTKINNSESVINNTDSELSETKIIENFNEDFFNFGNRINNSSTNTDDPVERINRNRFKFDKNIGSNISDIYDGLTNNQFKN